MRLAYLGTPALAVPPLRALFDAGFEIPLVVSAADKRRGRGSPLSPSPVKAAALDLGLPVTDRIDDLVDVHHEAAIDYGVVVAYGRLIRPHLLDEIEFLNLHFSLLPRWRGAAPVERAILAGDAETGVCLMQLEEGLDTGPVYRRVVEPIDHTDTLDTLRDRLVVIGTTMLVAALTDVVDGAASLSEPEPQVGEPIYASKLTTDDYRLDLTRSAAENLRIIRLGRAFAEFRGKRFRVWDAEIGAPSPSAGGEPGRFTVTDDGVSVATADGSLELVEVQPEGKPRMAADAWRNGAQLGTDDRLT